MATAMPPAPEEQHPAAIYLTIPAGGEPPRAAVSAAVPGWLTPLLQGITLLTVIGSVFAAGLKLGQTNEKLTSIERRLSVVDDTNNGVVVRLARIEEQLSALAATIERSSARPANPAR